MGAGIVVNLCYKNNQIRNRITEWESLIPALSKYIPYTDAGISQK